jgi:hypothetical protein
LHWAAFSGHFSRAAFAKYYVPALWPAYSFAKAKRKELQTVQSNIDAILNTTGLEKEPTSKDRS